MEELVWAFKPLKELNNETGLVACDAKLAYRLIEEGKVQDPRIGAHHFNEIEGTYETKVMKAKTPATAKPAAKKTKKNTKKKAKK